MGADTTETLACKAPDFKGDSQGAPHLVPEVFPYIMDIGEAMLKCGADVHTIEQTLVHVGKAYGAERMNVLVITAVIIMTVSYTSCDEQTFSRRVIGEGGTDFAKLDALSSLCEECCKTPLSPEELAKRLDIIAQHKFSDLYLFLGGALSAGGFAVFFGGTIIDGIVSALFALAVCVAIKYFKPLTPNVIIFNFVVSFVAGITICLVASLAPLYDVNLVIIGVIMLLIPGVTMTNATRDMLSGDTISGVMRFVESLLWACALALGFMAALWVASEAHWDYGRVVSTEKWSLVAMIPIVFVSSLGFALFFDTPSKHIVRATFGGLITWAVFYLCDKLLGGIFIPVLIASAFAAVYAEVLSRRFRIPNAAFFIVAVIPLIPGRLLYYTMFSAVNAAWADCASYALATVMYAAGIAVGICIIAGVMQTWDIWKERKSQHEAQRKALEV